MGLQTGAVTMAWLGVSTQPTLQPGVHLRWSIDPARGFPPFGFDVFRRSHRPGSSPGSVDFANSPLGDLSQEISIGLSTWTASDPYRPNKLVTRYTSQGSFTVLAVSSLTTCRIHSSQRPLRRIELDLVHWGPSGSSTQTIPFVLWGIRDDQRVAESRLTFDRTNYGQILTLAVSADALDGFQTKIQGYSAPYGIVRVRWIRVEDEATLGWGAPLNPRRIGFPLTAPGYLVPHGHSPDQGSGAQDWVEAADRMSPTGQAAGLPTALQQRFGPPTFGEARELMRRALGRELLVGQPASADEPRRELDAVRTTLLAASDPAFARLLGLGLVDRTAATGTRYDYRVTAYWPGPWTWQWVCTSMPSVGTAGRGGVTVTTSVPGPAGTTGTTVTVRRSTGSARRERVAWQPALRVVAGAELATAPALDAIPGIEIADLPSRTPIVRGTVSDIGVVVDLPRGPAPSDGVSTLRIELEQPTDGVRVQARSRGPEPLTVLALSSATVVAVEARGGGIAVDVTLTGSGISAVVVTGSTPEVTTLCQLRPVAGVIEESWISFDVSRGVVPVLAAPATPRATVVPGVATPSKPSEQAVALEVEALPSPVPARDDPLPFARLPLDAVVFEIERRADGTTPNPSGGGTWVELTRDAQTGRSRPVFRSMHRPTGYQTPPGWPPDPPQYLDDTIDGNTRYYSYRARVRDLFGRTSAWSAHVNVDCADDVGPPAPAALSARLLDPLDPWLSHDEATLAAGGTVVRVRWAWTRALSEQAPDAARFRVYFDPEPFHSLRARIDSVTPIANGYRLGLTILSDVRAPIAGDLVRDWVRQGSLQFFIRSNTAGNPCTVDVGASEGTAPITGECAVSLRRPDPERLDLLGSLLRRDDAAPVGWSRRLLQGPIGRVSGAVTANSPGAAVTVQQVTSGMPRSGFVTIDLATDWRWSGDLTDGAVIEVGASSYTIRAGSVGAAAKLVIELAGQSPPGTGAATVRAGTSLRTLRLSATPPSVTPFVLVGGLAYADGAMLPVLAHRVVGANLDFLVDMPAGAPATITQLEWFPDHEATISTVTLAVSDQQPIAVGVIGVSAVDGRPYAADRRTVSGEPTSAGNEGPIASVGIRREYRGAPTVQPSPVGTAGVGDLWASVPDEFSGTSRFALSWPKSGAYSFVVYQATLDAVLDADVSDRGAARGVYSGMSPLSGTSLQQWRAQHAQLASQQLQQLASGQSKAFGPIASPPLLAADTSRQDPQNSSNIRWEVPLDGSAPGRFFLRVRAVDAAGNAGPFGPSTLPIRVPDTRRPLAPRLRRVIADDRALWIAWDAADPNAIAYLVYRAGLAAGSAPDVRDMVLVATLLPWQCPEPIPVSGGEVRLPGTAPNAVVAIYRASQYDFTRVPSAQTAVPIAGTLALAGTTVSGLQGLPDGTLVVPVVRAIATSTSTVAASSTGRAYRDAALVAERPYQYRVIAVRQAQITAVATAEIRSLASNVAEGRAFDLSLPVPPVSTAVWQSPQVHVTWGTGGLAADLEVLLLRARAQDLVWRSATTWTPASQGSADDIGVTSGETYLYRLRVRDARGRQSLNEPVVGPLTIP